MVLQHMLSAPLMLLAEHEEALARLYRQYAVNFPELASFWEQLAGEEVAHAALIRALQALANEGAISLRPDRFHVAPVSDSLAYIEGEIVRAKTQPPAAVTALSIALHLELALIEKAFFTVIDADPKQVKRTMQRLSQETDRHIRRVRAMWFKAKKG